jgi:PadR family transcriptional regulator PadR
LPSGTVYPALRRFENAGLIDSEWEEPHLVEDRPPRKYYELTERGEQALSGAVKRYRVLQHFAPQRTERG